MGGGAALSAWVVEECNRISEQNLAEGGERTFLDLVHGARVRESYASEHLQLSLPAKLGAQSKGFVDTR